MELGFTKANTTNLPNVDSLMMGEILVSIASNKNFSSEDFKTSISCRPSYGDDAVNYVQLKREANLCTLKAKICPELEQKVTPKLYRVTLIVDEDDFTIKSVQCHDCNYLQRGCIHGVAFLLWVHCRIEEPTPKPFQCYWRKPKLSGVMGSLRYITAKQLSNGKPNLPTNSDVFKKLVKEETKRKLTDSELLKYQKDFRDT